MRSQYWRFVCAACLVQSVMLITKLAAQNCPSCMAGGDASCIDASGSTPCWDEHAGQPCRNRACYGARPYTEQSQPDVFYNFYVPNNMGSAAAAYPSPIPTPNWVGHTYYTYQPLMPHEFMYKHHRTYRQGYDNGMGMNRTTVRWYGTPIHTTAKNVAHWFSIAR